LSLNFEGFSAGTPRARFIISSFRRVLLGYYKEANFKLLANEQLVDTKSDTQEFEKDED
jgi:hypothetical protein